MKYKVQSDTSNQFTGIEIDYVIEDFTIGRELMFLGEKFTLKQNGVILVLGNKDRVITIQNKEEKVKPISKIIAKENLRINHEIDIFFETKEFQIKSTERLEKIRYEVFYEFIKDEWKMAGVLANEEFPLELRDNNLLLKNSWNFTKGSFVLLIDGSFTRENEWGNVI